MSQLLIIHAGEPSQGDRSILGLVTFCGVGAEFFWADQPGVILDHVAEYLSRVKAVAISVAAACALEDRGIPPDSLLDLSGNSITHFLLHGFQPEKRHQELVQRLTEGRVSRIRPVIDGSKCSFPEGSGSYTSQLAGCAFERERSPSDCCFGLEPGFVGETLMCLGGEPVFILAPRRGASLYLWTAVDSIPHPLTRIAEGELTRRCDRFIPLFIFLRSAFKGFCWENPVKTARIIIDDPLLRRRYGFLRYDHLLQSAATEGYAVTTAFIPWNYRRTSKRDARFFAQHQLAHSICIHGCDHTNNEFGITDENILQSKAFLSCMRMQEHRQRTGICCDKVMVFPQGKFSTVAIRALRHAGFLAVVNTSLVPTDFHSAGLILAEELMPAVTCQSGLPIFARRYPKNLHECALDLFLGKPAHLVEHHDWFKNGIGDTEHCARWLKSVQPNLSWPPLGEALRRQHLRRRSANGDYQIRFFTPEFNLENPENSDRLFRFTKSEPDPGLPESVFINGKTVSFAHKDGQIAFDYELGPRQHAFIVVADASPTVSKSWAPSFHYRAKLRLRRVLSEIRDDHLARHPKVLRAAKKIARTMHWSSDAKLL